MTCDVLGRVDVRMQRMFPPALFLSAYPPPLWARTWEEEDARALGQQLAALGEALELAAAVDAVEHHVAGKEHGPADDGDQEVGRLGDKLEGAVEKEERVDVLRVLM